MYTHILNAFKQKIRPCSTRLQERASFSGSAPVATTVCTCGDLHKDILKYYVSGESSACATKNPTDFNFLALLGTICRW